ncbi:MAG: glycosyltransferase family 4 protein [Desulfobacca sp.]|uniref:glycosyltransferase family 4 protein n=1 Tax=Desulfobacca sp. TaxID=2067990 RepID=UPI00404AFE9B
MATVAHVAPELFPVPPIRGGAAELFIEQVAARLPGWQSLVICRADPELPTREERGPVRYVRLPLAGWRFRLYKRYRHLWPWYDRQVLAVIQETNPDLVHVHNRPLLALYLQHRLQGRIPVLLHLHNLYESLGRRERPPVGTLIPVAACLACSRFVLERECQRLGFGAASHFVVYNGVNPAAFPCRWSAPELGQRVRQRYGLGQEPVVLFVGKVRESKGVGVLLEAMAQVWQQVPQAVLLLAGGTEYGRGRTGRQTPFYRRLQAKLQQAAGRVLLTGFIPPQQIAAIYQAGDIFVGPSQVEEGLGIVFLEAAASGLPVIASGRGGIPEIVRPGETGLLLQQHDDARELAGYIRECLADATLRERLGRQGCQWVRQHFTWDHTAHRLVAVYAAVCALQGTPGGAGVA